MKQTQRGDDEKSKRAMRANEAPKAKMPETDALEKEVSRRGFLRGALALGAGLAAPAVLTKPGQAQGLPPHNPTQNDGKGDMGATDKRGGRFEVKSGATARLEARVHLNQAGFLPDEPKRAVIAATGPIPGGKFSVVDDDVLPKTRFQGSLRAWKEKGPGAKDDPPPKHYIADFDAFTTPGRYRLRLSNGRLSAPFSIGGDLYGRLIPLIQDYFDVQCCGPAVSSVRQACHHDDGLLTGGPRKGETLDTSGGWHDAGDYLKFVETTSYVAGVMLFAYDHFPGAFPASSGGHGHPTLPRVLAQAKIGVDWLLRMHPAPDEFYYQVGDASDHESWRLPERDSPAFDKNWKPRPVYYGIGANLAGRTAATFALAARLYHRYDRQFASRCLEAAQSVFALGEQNPAILTTTPDDYYPEKTWQDDMAWGAACLYQATDKPEYLQIALKWAHAAGPAQEGLSVYNTHALAHFTLYPLAGSKDAARLREYLRADAVALRDRADNPYGLSVPYSWGTTAGATGAALSCLLYARLTGDSPGQSFEETARRQRDFTLGCNPFGLSCLIGAGTRYALFPHHQIADLNGLELSGALIGGPATLGLLRKEKMTLTDVELGLQAQEASALNSQPDDTGVYHDTVEDYVTNEPANDYTVQFLLLAAAYHPDHAEAVKPRGKA